MRAFFIALLASAFATSAIAAEEVPARVLRRVSPNYPEKCLPDGPGPYPIESVTVAYDVTRDGVA